MSSLNNATGMISVVDSGFFAPLFQYNSGLVGIGLRLRKRKR
jgi:hypothetical protein